MLSDLRRLARSWSCAQMWVCSHDCAMVMSCRTGLLDITSYLFASLVSFPGNAMRCQDAVHGLIADTLCAGETKSFWNALAHRNECSVLLVLQEWTMTLEINKGKSRVKCIVKRPSGASYLFFQKFFLKIGGKYELHRGSADNVRVQFSWVPYHLAFLPLRNKRLWKHREGNNTTWANKSLEPFPFCRMMAQTTKCTSWRKQRAQVSSVVTPTTSWSRFSSLISFHTFSLFSAFSRPPPPPHPLTKDSCDENPQILEERFCPFPNVNGKSISFPFCQVPGYLLTRLFVKFENYAKLTRIFFGLRVWKYGFCQCSLNQGEGGGQSSGGGGGNKVQGGQSPGGAGTKSSGEEGTKWGHLAQATCTAQPLDAWPKRDFAQWHKKLLSVSRVVVCLEKQSATVWSTIVSLSKFLWSYFQVERLCQ